MDKKYSSFSVGLAISMMMLTLASASHAEVVSMDEAADMDKHWDVLIHEKDRDKQKALIREHKERMSGYSNRKDLKNIHRTSSNENMEKNMDLINTIDMHKKMMWMLDRMH